MVMLYAYSGSFGWKGHNLQEAEKRMKKEFMLYE